MRLIDADALIDDIKNNLWDWKTVDGITATTVLKQTISDIGNQQTIEERNKGQWFKEQTSGRWFCDQCLSPALKTDDGMENLSDFCPVCGAKMEGVYYE